MILLDTDVCIEILRGNTKVLEHLSLAQETACISFMTVAELYYGAEKSNQVEKNKTNIERFLLATVVWESTIHILKKFGELKAKLDKTGNLIEDADLFIAATSLTHCKYLVTGNVKHYQRIPELEIRNWIR
jgi:tRNA(fMet)-specific endonuclease VapC